MWGMCLVGGWLDFWVAYCGGAVLLTLPRRFSSGIPAALFIQAIATVNTERTLIGQ